MKFKKSNLLILLSSIIFVIGDLITKRLIDNTFELMEPKVLINNFLYFTKVYNTGASFNILDGFRFFLIIIAIIIIILLLGYQGNFKNNFRNKLSFSLIYGGIIGNLIDRVYYGYVIDFIDVKIFGYDYPVFNVADMCICIGVFLLIIAILKKEDKNEIRS